MQESADSCRWKSQGVPINPVNGPLMAVPSYTATSLYDWFLKDAQLQTALKEELQSPLKKNEKSAATNTVADDF